MPLVLSLREGDDFYVGDTRFELDSIEHGNLFWVAEDGSDLALAITDEQAVEIAPGVMASSGDYYMTGAVRIVLEAPREIVILRGERYRLAHPSPSGA